MMKRLAVAACLLTLACDDDPARSVKISANPPAPVQATALPPAAPPPAAAPSAAAPPTGAETKSPAPARSRRETINPPAPAWQPDACPPPPEDSSGPSRLTVAGPCPFQHRGAVSCTSALDDFILVTSRKAAGGATLMIYINVEKYHGPGAYEDAQMFVGLQDKTLIYRWSSDTVSITVGPDEAFAVLPATRLEAEPLLVGCAGPMSNYQCDGRGESPHIGTITEVSGRLQCKDTRKEQ